MAPPDTEWCGDVEWVTHYPGARCYCRLSHEGGRKHWRFTAGTVRPGEIFLTQEEHDAADRLVAGRDRDRLVIVEPNVKHQAPNKRWGHDRYASVARVLAKAGYRVAQFVTGGMALADVEPINAGGFRVACAVLQRARLYVGPEGGLHHAAAALGVPAVVIFGGFISPAVTGYDTHRNHFSGDGLGCGTIDPCDHCRSCMDKISHHDVACDALAVLEG